ncbi:MAG: hypothetical protein DMF41_08665 [Verrucomicrobia bacterium]|nr:MAG: hypothetical protein DMF41_08665 [Verrucomicrobiota bacterium]
MRKEFVRLTMFICLGSAVTSLYAIPSEKQFDGEWGSHKGFDFGIHLHQNGNRLNGYHSGVTKDGSRTDTAPDGEGSPSITGTIKGNTAVVDVHSTYSDAVLKVRLTLHDRSLDWKVIEVKQSGDYYIPDKATLYKEHWDPKKGWVRDRS